MLDNFPFERSSNLWSKHFPPFLWIWTESDDCCYLEEHTHFSTVVHWTVTKNPWNFTHYTYLLHRLVDSDIFLTTKVLWSFMEGKNFYPQPKLNANQTNATCHHTACVVTSRCRERGGSSICLQRVTPP